MAVRSAIMEHVKSTIAATAVMVMGLITAAHVLHPHDPALERPRGTMAAAASHNATTWSDPPAREAPAAAAAATQAPRPASFTLLSNAMMASLPVGETALQPRRSRKAEAGRGQKLVQFASRGRSAAAEPGANLRTAKPDDVSGQSRKAAQGDPIGDLLKGLGIGRDREG
ncbi:hypothetical protein [uncultured Methylobacterium sp.]|uniref:hypothetical protein n=1 Tax=uncultured Methylobacterium sp. TaxID=157278 RepID=UPI0035CC22A2